MNENMHLIFFLNLEIRVFDWSRDHYITFK